jgi:hypothetical protein
MNEAYALFKFNDIMGEIGAQPSTELSAELLRRAETWPTYPSTRRQRYPGHQVGPRVACRRCTECRGVIYDTQDVAGHLLQMHGFRMDGRQWDDSNKEVTTHGDGQESPVVQ